MSNDKYVAILRSLALLQSKNDKLSFLANSIEETDTDDNGLNEDLINLYREIKEKL